MKCESTLYLLNDEKSFQTKIFLEDLKKFLLFTIQIDLEKITHLQGICSTQVFIWIFHPVDMKSQIFALYYANRL